MQHLRRHIAPASIARDASSDSDSGGGDDEGVGVCAPAAERVVGAFPMATGVGLGVLSGSIWGASFAASGASVSSTVECFPVVHGGMLRNSSKLRTRGLQHFHPVVAKLC